MSIHHLPSDPRTAALAGAVAQIDRAFAGRKGPPARHAPLFAVRTCATVVSLVPARTRAKNLATLEAYVGRHRRIAAGLCPAEGDRHLETTARHLDGLLEQIGAEGRTPQHLRGIDAFDLSNARDSLMAAANPVVA